MPTSYHIDPKACLQLNHQTCGLCAVVCQKNAIRFDDVEQILELPVGAVVLAPPASAGSATTSSAITAGASLTTSSPPSSTSG